MSLAEGRPPRWSQGFTVRAGGRNEDISIGISEPFPGPGSLWQCTLTVDAVEGATVRPVLGISALQALELAIDNLRLEEWQFVIKFGLKLLDPVTLEPEFDEAELRIYLSNPPRLAARRADA